jgi:microcystin-dependent protein
VPFPPTQKTMEGLLRDNLERLTLVERRLAIGGTGDGGGGSTAPPPYDAQPGLVAPFAGGAIPSGWLLCDGTAYPRSGFPDLYALIGTTYGAGDGSTTFNVPNYKGRVLVGRDPAQTEFDVLGEVGGAKTHTLSVAEMPSHNHPANMNTTGYGGGIAGSAFFGPQYPSHANYEGIVGPRGDSQPHNNLQPYAVTNYIISTGSGVGGGGSATPALPDPQTRYGPETNPMNQGSTAWVDIPNTAVVLDLPYPAWVRADFTAQLNTTTTASYSMIGVNTTGALVVGPEFDQNYGSAQKFPNAPFSMTVGNINIRGEKLLLLPKGKTTLTMQMRRSAVTGAQNADYPMLHVTVTGWVGAPGANVSKDFYGGKVWRVGAITTGASLTTTLLNYTATDNPTIWNAATPSRILLPRAGRWRVQMRARVDTFNAQDQYAIARYSINGAGYDSSAEYLMHGGVGGVYLTQHDIITLSAAGYIEFAIILSSAGHNVTNGFVSALVEWLGIG